MQIILLSEARSDGLPFYYTGKPCKRGHVAHRRVNGRRCTECESIIVSKWAAENRDKVQEWKRRYNRANPDKVREWKQREYQKNTERYRRANQEWAECNREKRREYVRRSEAKHADAKRERGRLWRQRNPEANAVKARRYRARKAGASGEHTHEEIKQLLRKQRGSCASCRSSLAEYHADHIVPLALGGSDDIVNIQLLCPNCNSRKSYLDPVVWAQREGRLI